MCAARHGQTEAENNSAVTGLKQAAYGSGGGGKFLQFFVVNLLILVVSQSCQTLLTPLSLKGIGKLKLAPGVRWCSCFSRILRIRQ